MKAVQLKKFGGVEELFIGNVPTPDISEEEVLVKVRASALNRADLLQRKGMYPPPPGESEIIGLEMAGEVVEVGNGVDRWNPGDRVFALLAGGGYAEYVKVHKNLLMPLPKEMDFLEAAGIAEAFLTAYQAIVWHLDIQAKETLLIHAGASGVGTAAIQLAKMKKAVALVTASAGKHQLCKELGADLCIDYKTRDFASAILAKYPNGIPALLDFIGGPYFKNNIKVLARDGRMVMLGFMGGTKVESLDLLPVLFKRLKIMGSTLRARPLEYKARLIAAFSNDCLPAFDTGGLKPVLDRVFNWKEVADAHLYMESNKNKGKVILQMD